MIFLNAATGEWMGVVDGPLREPWLVRQLSDGRWITHRKATLDDMAKINKSMDDSDWPLSFSLPESVVQQMTSAIPPMFKRTDEQQAIIDLRIEEFSAATSNAANLLGRFFEGLKVDGRAFEAYVKIALSHSDLLEDIPELKAAIRQRQEAQTAMLQAIAGGKKPWVTPAVRRLTPDSEQAIADEKEGA